MWFNLVLCQLLLYFCIHISSCQDGCVNRTMSIKAKNRLLKSQNWSLLLLFLIVEVYFRKKKKKRDTAELTPLFEVAWVFSCFTCTVPYFSWLRSLFSPRSFLIKKRASALNIYFFFRHLLRTIRHDKGCRGSEGAFWCSGRLNNLNLMNKNQKIFLF